MASLEMFTQPNYKQNNHNISKVTLSNFDFYRRGFNKITKDILIKDFTLDFAKERKVDPELCKKLWEKMFAASLNDPDLPLTKEGLIPVKKHLSKIINKGGKLTAGNFESVLQEWQLSCLIAERKNNSFMDKIKALIKKYFSFQKQKVNRDQKVNLEAFFKENYKKLSYNSEIDLTIKAPILKGLIDNNIDRYEKFRGVKVFKDTPTAYYYKELRRIESSYIDYNSHAGQKNIAKSTFFQNKVNLEKKMSGDKVAGNNKIIY